MAAKVRALQQWCKIRCEGYRDVEITNMTSSWKSGLAFCAIIHRYRPDLINYDALKKEDTYDNCKLAFDVGLEQLGIPALLDPEDMVTMTVPDKLCIVTYVAQYYNYLHDKPLLGGPDVKGTPQIRAVKRPSIQPSIHTSSKEDDATSGPDAKNKKIASGINQPNTSGDAKRSTMDDNCHICRKKVYLLERHYANGKLCHRSCQRDAEKISASQRNAERHQNKDDITVNGSNHKPSDQGKVGYDNHERLNRATERTDDKSTPASSALLKHLYPSPPAYNSQPNRDAGSNGSALSTAGRGNVSNPNNSKSNDFQSNAISKQFEPSKPTTNPQFATNRSATTSTVSPSSRLITSSTSNTRQTVVTSVAVSNPTPAARTTVTHNIKEDVAAGRRAVSDYAGGNIVTNPSGDASIPQSHVPPIIKTVSSNSVIVTPHRPTSAATTKSNGEPLSFGVVFTVSTSSQTSITSKSVISNASNTSVTTSTSSVYASSVVKPRVSTVQESSSSSSAANPSSNVRKPFIIKPPAQNNEARSASSANSDKDMVTGLLQNLSNAVDRKNAATSNIPADRNKITGAEPQKPPRRSVDTRHTEINPNGPDKVQANVIPRDVANKEHLDENKRPSSGYLAGGIANNANPATKIPMPPRPIHLGNETKPSWQLEAEKRISSRNGVYIDPEKVPRSVSPVVKPGEHGNPPARPPPPRVASPRLNKKVNDVPGNKILSSTNHVVEIQISEPARKIVISPSSPEGHSNNKSNHPSTTTSTVVFNISGINSSGAGAKVVPKIEDKFSPNPSKPGHLSPPVAAPRASNNKNIENNIFPSDYHSTGLRDTDKPNSNAIDQYGSPDESRTRDCLHDTTPESGKKKKIIPTQKFSFEDEMEKDRKSQIIPGNVFTMSPTEGAESKLPEFEDTTEEVRGWLDSNRTKIEGGFNVPMRQVNAEKRMAETLINTRLEQLDVGLRKVEMEGRDLEEQIRSRNDEAMDDDQDDLMIKWFLLVKQRYELIRDETELLYKRRAQELEDNHGEIEYQLRRLMQKPDYMRTNEDKELEEVLLHLLVKTVTDRNSIVDSMESDRLRYLEEDKNIDEMLQASGLSTPVAQYGNDRKKQKKKSKEEGDGKSKKSILRALSLRKKSVPNMETNNSSILL